MTKRRQKIYQCITESTSPLNSSQIHKEIDDKMDLATVYRGLQYLTEQKMISSFIFECEQRGMERYYISNTEKHRHFMHCRDCHSFMPYPGCPVNKIEQKEINGFLIESHNITFTGQCKECRDKKQELS